MRSWQMDTATCVLEPFVAEPEEPELEPAELESVAEEEPPREPSRDADAETLLKVGLMHAIGRLVPLDLVAAHKWLNLAAMRGNGEAARLRQEIASDMSAAEIAAAQRAARDWLVHH